MATTLATKRPEFSLSPQYRRQRAVQEPFGRVPSRSRFVEPVLALATGFSLAAAPAFAQTFRVTPSIAVEETFTTNVNLEPRADAKNDFITQITPSLSVNELGNRLKLQGSISAPILIYARTGADNDKVEPQVSLVGNAELVEKLLFVEALVSVTQAYVSPFGARPVTLTTTTGNRFTAETYTVSPYVVGGRGDYSYELRDKHIWTTSNGSVASIPTSSYTNEIVGSLSRRPLPVGWTVQFDRSDVKFSDQGALLTQMVRARAIWRPDPQVELSGGGGYEDNRYTAARYKDPTYGFGVRWQPTERTTVSADYEHRFFGASYNLAFSHRTPLSVWSVQATRDTSTYPQQLATLPAGSNVSALLNQLLLSIIPDPIQRQAYIDELIRSGNLPPLLGGPVTLLTQQVLLREYASGTVGLLGVRNEVFLSIFRSRSQPVAGAGIALEGAVSSLADNTQTGGSIVWTHKLTPSLAMNASADVLRTTANASSFGTTNQGALRSTLTTPLSANTSAYAGVRYQRLHSDVTSDFNEFALYVGLSHVFRR